MAAGLTEADWGAPGRTTRYYAKIVDPFTLIDTSEEIELDLDGTSITYAYESDNHMEATVTISEGDYHNIISQGRTMDGMIRIYQTVTTGSFAGEFCMGTFYVSNLSNSSKYGITNRKLTCYGPMWAMTQDSTIFDFIRHPGDNCWDAMQYICTGGGHDNGHIRAGDGFDTGRTHTIEIFFPLGTNRGEMLNTYAGWLNGELVTDMDGTIVARPYIDPWNRPIMYTFDENEGCIYKAGIEFETNRDEPLNRVMAYFSRESKQDDPSKDNYDPYPLSDSVYVDLPDSADYSFARCGRRRTEVLHVTDPCSHEDLQAQAQRYLDENSHSNLYINVEHAGIPGLRVGDVVRYINSRDQYRTEPGTFDNRCLVTEMRISKLSPFCMTQTKMRVI